MLTLYLTAAVAFSAGFAAAGLLTTGRRRDAACGEALLADAVDQLAAVCADRGNDRNGRAMVARSQLDRLFTARNARETLHST